MADRTRCPACWTANTKPLDGSNHQCRSCMMRFCYSAHAALRDRADAMAAALAGFRFQVLNKADDDPFHHSWNPDAHVEFTLSIGEIRQMLAALAAYRGDQS